MDDHSFIKTADAFMESIMQTLSEMDPDEVDVDLSMGVLAMEFADGSKCIMNRQTAAHQIWLAHGATAWHFSLEDGEWRDTKGRGELRAVLAEQLSQKLGRPVEV